MLFRIDERKFFLTCAEQCESVTGVLKKAGCSVVILNRISKGKPVQSMTLGKICKVLKCSPNDLLAE